MAAAADQDGEAEPCDEGCRVIVHPISGEVIPDELDALVAAEKEVDGFLRSLQAHYGFRLQLRQRIAEKRGPSVLPSPRLRSEKQWRVSVCPRCGGKS